MSHLAHRIKNLEGHCTPVPELVREWAQFLRALQGTPGVSTVTLEELRAAAKAEAARGWTPAEMWMKILEQVWAEEGR